MADPRIIVTVIKTTTTKPLKVELGGIKPLLRVSFAVGTNLSPQPIYTAETANPLLVLT